MNRLQVRTAADYEALREEEYSKKYTQEIMKLQKKFDKAQEEIDKLRKENNKLKDYIRQLGEEIYRDLL